MHSLLEDYLNEVAKSLRPLPVARRSEELREIRQHLLIATIVNQERGQSEDEAAVNALKQFGTPAEVGESVVLAWLRGYQKMNRWIFWVFAVFTLYLESVSLRLTLTSNSHHLDGNLLCQVLWGWITFGNAYLRPSRKKSNGTYGQPVLGLGPLLFLTVLGTVCWINDNGHWDQSSALVRSLQVQAGCLQAFLYLSVVGWQWYKWFQDKRDGLAVTA